ncbi:hypothetical protein Esi_0033_0005 [Ectocarpus siliculosus]|uniref:Uncharacterized protein n=1 Tax=Ectocarpus siliculosus TaxID=2880 RepID=D7FXP9_ECTSI|nr:hypothetical protein Esi_0033_0005 [Ectocarpus siliculosus]|eukprot:CBJ26416.1 hypothetical protein Esi_0033_0005 [Ectocarpus siliculosus]
MWSAERQIDGLTARNAQLETHLACLEADVQTYHRVHDLLQTDLLCTIRDGETTLGKKDAEICSLTKDREIERLKAQLLHSKEVDGAQDIADRSTEPPSPSLHSRWGSADNVDGASIFRAGNNSADSKTPCGRKAPNASAAIIAAAGTFVYSKASRRATDKLATNVIATSAVSDADSFAAEALIADARLEAWGLTMRRAATSAGN